MFSCAGSILSEGKGVRISYSSNSKINNASTTLIVKIWNNFYSKNKVINLNE